jgi:transposase-like protein
MERVQYVSVENVEAGIPFGAAIEVDIRCPYCSSVDCHRSMRHGRRDFLRRLFGKFPWRCHGCRNRFYLRKRSPG